LHVLVSRCGLSLRRPESMRTVSSTSVSRYRGSPVFALERRDRLAASSSFLADRWSLRSRSSSANLGLERCYVGFTHPAIDAITAAFAIATSVGLALCGLRALTDRSDGPGGLVAVRLPVQAA
jgi:hypothetical protein